MFLPAVLIPACASSSPAFLMIYSVYKLNKQGNSIQPCTPFIIWSWSTVPCKVLTIGYWLTYRFLRRQVMWSGTPYVFKNLPQFVVIHTIKAFRIVNEAEVDVFQNSPAFSMIQWILAIWPLVLLPLRNPACPSGSSWFTYCWSLAWRILSITLLACEMNRIIQ